MGDGEELSGNLLKVYKIMQEMGFTTEDKMGTAERITMTSKLPKNMVMNALQDLQAKGFVRRRVREKAAGYFIVK